MLSKVASSAARAVQGPSATAAASARLASYIERYERCTGQALRTGAAGAFYARVDTKYARTLAMIEGEDVAFEGVPAAGKTTAMRSTARAVRALGGAVDEYPEDRDDEMLNEFFKDKAHYGFWFQMFKLRGRQHICNALLHESAELSRSGGTAKRKTRFLDRTLPGDMAFAFWNYAMGFFTDEQLDIYFKYATKIKYPTPFLVLYLTASPARLVERVRRRGIAAEMVLYTEDYFRLMDVCYRTALDISGCAYCVVDWEADDEGVGVPADAPVKPDVPLGRCMALLEHAIATVYRDNISRIRALSSSDDAGSDSDEDAQRREAVSIHATQRDVVIAAGSGALADDALLQRFDARPASPVSVLSVQGPSAGLHGADPALLARRTGAHLRASADALRKSPGRDSPDRSADGADDTPPREPAAADEHAILFNRAMVAAAHGVRAPDEVFVQFTESEQAAIMETWAVSGRLTDTPDGSDEDSDLQ